MAAIIFIGVLVILVLVHEAGHFFAARWGGVAVDEFGFGFPPRAVGFQKGKTLYSINWLPLGGFVRLKGEEGEQPEEIDSFAHASIGRRSWIIVAGVTMNVVFATFLFWILFTFGLTVPMQGVYVDAVLPNTPAANAGILPGDQIRSVNGEPMHSVEAFQGYLRAQNGQPITISLGNANKEERTVSLTPAAIPGLATPGLGVQLASEGMVQYPWYQAPWEAIKATIFILWEIIRAFAMMLYTIFTQWQVDADVSGPIGIAVATGKIAHLGLSNLLYFVALLSLNLAVINVLPIPALDGGRLLFLVIEKIRGHAVHRNVEKWFHLSGFIFLILLVVLVTYRDLTQHGNTILNAIRQWIPFTL